MQIKTCQKCGTKLRPDIPEGVCPRCLVQAGIDLSLGDAPNVSALAGDASANAPIPESDLRLPGARSDRPVVALAGRRFGDYELLEEIARGGMGVVYKARQVTLNRLVAVKMIQAGVLASPEMVLRFRAEAEAVGSLRHPNIVAIYETGEHEGHHYFSMDYVQGRNLAELLREQPLSAKRAAGYLEKIARAVHYAHLKGVLHRDLKPTNVLIDENNEPRITDFGLAKRLTTDSSLVTGHSSLTLTGQLLGSPNFMPPEQASANRGHVGAPSDVYGLGAILYYLLTGRPPFQAETLTVVLQQLAHADPIAPRRLNPSVPRDLETICLKCLEKDPRRRYQTAEELADELRHFQAGEPIQARPVAATEKAWRWCRRKPQVAGLAALALLFLFLGFAGVTWQWKRAKAGELATRRYLYAADVQSAQQALEANNLGRALELLDRHRPSFVVPALAGAVHMNHPDRLKAGLQTDLRGWEWRYLWQQSRSDADLVIGSLPGGIRDLAASSDDRFLAAASEFGTVKVWDLSTRQAVELVPEGGVQSFLAFSPDAQLLMFTDQSSERPGTIGLWDTRARQRLASMVNTNYVGPLGFSPDGRWLAFGVMLPDASNRLLVQEFAARKQVSKLVGQTPVADTHHGYAFVFTPDGQQIVVSETDGRIMRWNFLAGSEPEYFNAHQDGVTDGVTAMASNSSRER